ncbi:DUF4407 domain-containing protein [Echinicola sp. 20G]|uniref:DUF4407 domain-containing protein n=1 Tax=Echinicola sp. 20G TaxID=2781961 RepID=UPI0019105AF9|nr:DUF4407 domain-containing protein [Echinicola sp. 20G]
MLSGDDYNVVGKCDKSTQHRFTAIGVLVACIFVLCFISCYFAFTKLFQNYYTGIPIGLFFAWMITNIYLFLLYTLSKTGFPYIPNKPARYVATTIRLVFIAFIAIVVSKPIESLVFSKQLALEMQSFKQDKIERYEKSTNVFFADEINIIKDIIAQQKVLNNVIDEEQLSNYNELIRSKEEERDRLIKSMRILVGKSDYYIQGMIILNTKYPICWAITLFGIIIFIIPTYLKIFIHKDSIFYKTKHYIESYLVKYEYELFKEKYSEIFRYKYGIDIQYTECYTDPPFNTKRKIDKRERAERTVLTEDDLLNSLYAKV